MMSISLYIQSRFLPRLPSYHLLAQRRTSRHKENNNEVDHHFQGSNMSRVK